MGGICCLGGPSLPQSFQPLAHTILEVPVILSSATPQDSFLYKPMRCHMTQPLSFSHSLTTNQMISYSTWQGNHIESGNSLL